MGLTEKEKNLLNYILNKETKIADQAIELTGTPAQINYWEQRKKKIESIRRKIA